MIAMHSCGTNPFFTWSLSLAVVLRREGFVLSGAAPQLPHAPSPPLLPLPGARTLNGRHGHQSDVALELFFSLFGGFSEEAVGRAFTFLVVGRNASTIRFSLFSFCLSIRQSRSPKVFDMPRSSP